MPALGGAALTAVLFLVRGPVVAEKNGPAIAAWVKRPSTGREWAPAPDEVLAVGDELKLQVSPGGFARITLFKADASGAFGQLHSQQVSGTTTLPFTLVLDDAPGPETLYVLFSMRPLPELSREAVQAERVELGGEQVEVRKRVVRKK